MKEETVLMILESLMAETSRRFTDNERTLKIRNWTIKLKDITEEQGMKGLEKALDLPLDFMPSIGTFKEYCLTDTGQSSIEEQGIEAWYLAYNNLNHTVSPIFKNSAIAETIRKMGGWVKFSTMLTKDEPFIKIEFIELYTVLKRRSQEYYPCLSGTYKTNKFIGYKKEDDLAQVLIEIEKHKKTQSTMLEMLNK